MPKVSFLGGGGFGDTYKYEAEEKTVAIKEILMDGDTEKMTINEFKMMEKIRTHPNVVKYHYKLKREKNMYIFMEYLNGKNLCKHKVNEKGIHEVWNFIMQMAVALASLGKKNIVHRDIKKDNIMALKLQSERDSMYWYKLIDFGIAEIFTEKNENSPVGNYSTMPPEAATSSGYDEKFDIFSLGLVLYSICYKRQNPTNKHILSDLSDIMDLTYFDPSGRNDQRQKIEQNIKTDLLQKLIRRKRKILICNKFKCQELDILIERMLSYNPEDRPTAVEILRMRPVYWKLKQYVKTIMNLNDYSVVEEVSKKKKNKNKSTMEEFI